MGPPSGRRRARLYVRVFRSSSFAVTPPALLGTREAAAFEVIARNGTWLVRHITRCVEDGEPGTTVAASQRADPSCGAGRRAKRSSARTAPSAFTGRRQRRGCEMKRFRLAATWVAMIGLAACQGRTPTAPSGAVGGPASVVLNDGSDSLTARLTASPSTISAGQSATLTWTTTDA